LQFFKKLSKKRYKEISSQCRKRYQKYHSINILKNFFFKKISVVPTIQRNYQIKKVKIKYNFFLGLEYKLINIFRFLRIFFIKKSIYEN